jgi:hypothetical protein
MKPIACLVGIAALVFAVTPAFAQDAATVAGTWKITVQYQAPQGFELPEGANTGEMKLQADGNKLTGSIQSFQGESKVTGTLDGAKVKLSATSDFNGVQVTMQYSATLDKDTMKGSMTFAVPGLGGGADAGGGAAPGLEIPFTAERVKTDKK